MKEFLRTCNVLRSLHLVFCWRHNSEVDLDSVFDDLELGTLRSIALSNALLGPAAFSYLVHHHQDLDSVHLISGEYDLSDIDPGSFKHLRSFGTNTDVMIVDLARIGAPRLEELYVPQYLTVGGRVIHVTDDVVNWQPIFAPFQDTLKRVVVSNDLKSNILYPLPLAPGIMLMGGLEQDVD